MLYQKAKIENGQMVITETKVIDQSKLTSDCWLIQFSGLSACETCDCLNTPDCGGQAIRKQLLEEKKCEAQNQTNATNSVAKRTAR